MFCGIGILIMLVYDNPTSLGLCINNVSYLLFKYLLLSANRFNVVLLHQECHSKDHYNNGVVGITQKSMLNTSNLVTHLCKHLNRRLHISSLELVMNWGLVILIAFLWYWIRKIFVDLLKVSTHGTLSISRLIRKIINPSRTLGCSHHKFGFYYAYAWSLTITLDMF